jgi:hypothetical protein
MCTSQVYRANEFWTSQKCPTCQHFAYLVNPSNKGKSPRVSYCPCCNAVRHRDTMAAINIASLGLSQLIHRSRPDYLVNPHYNTTPPVGTIMHRAKTIPYTRFTAMMETDRRKRLSGVPVPPAKVLQFHFKTPSMRAKTVEQSTTCLLYTSPSPRDH